MRIIHANYVPKTDDSMLTGSKSDPFVVINFPDKKSEKTSVKKNSLKPIWNEEKKHRVSIISTVSHQKLQFFQK